MGKAIGGKKFLVVLPRKQLAGLAALAEKTNDSRSQLIRNAVAMYLDYKEKQAQHLAKMAEEMPYAHE